MKGRFGFRPSPGVDFPTPLDAIEADFASVLLFSSLVRTFVPGLERPTVQIGRRDDEFRVIEIRIFGDEGRKPTHRQGTWDLNLGQILSCTSVTTALPRLECLGGVSFGSLQPQNRVFGRQMAAF